MSDKYPRTYHLPWSPGATSDDKVAKSIVPLLHCELVITEKMDGSNVCLTPSNCFARTHAHPPKHESFDALKALHAAVQYQIQERQEVFGEWLYAQHSISYTALPAYFLGFGIRNQRSSDPDPLIETKAWYEWDKVVEYLTALQLKHVPVLFRGIVTSERELQTLTETLVEQPSLYGGQLEGCVVRIAGSFFDANFSQSVMKWVRKDHVQTDEHWTKKTIVKNGLAKE